MQTSFQCPYCHSVLQADTSWSGQQTQCPHCNSMLTIPAFQVREPQVQLKAQQQVEMINTRCPGCNQEYIVQSSAIGTTCQCSHCGSQFIIQKATNDDNEDEGKFSASEVLNEFKKVSWNDIFPYKEIFKLENFDNPVVRFVVFFVVFPFFSSLWILDNKYVFYATIIFYFNMLWVFVFCSQLDVRKKLLFKGFGYMLFTATVGVLVCLVMQRLPIINGLYKDINQNLVGALFGFVFGVGPVEEFTKLLPLLVFGVLRRQIKNSRMGIFLGLMSGLGFALSESIDNVDIFSEKAGAVGALFQMFFRVLCLSFLHGAWCGIIGYNLGLNIKKQTRPLWPTVVASLAVSSVLHGLYDFCSPRWWAAAMLAAISVLLFTCLASKAARENHNLNGNSLLSTLE